MVAPWRGTSVMLVLAGALVAPAGTAGAQRVIRVGGGSTINTITSALDGARDGDTILVAPGKYRERLRVEHAVTIIGAPGHASIIDGDSRGTTIDLAADGASLIGFTVDHSGHSLNEDDAAILVDSARGVRVADNVIRHPLHGIYLLSAESALIEGNDILGDSSLIEPMRGNGIHLFNSNGSRIARNTIRGTRDGMYFSFSGHDTVSDNVVTQVRYGLHYMYSDDNLFERNRFTHNAAGTAIMMAKRITFRDNLFADHVGYRGYGILLQQGEYITAEHNRIIGNLTGVFLDGALGCVFKHNEIAGNGVGIDLLASSEENVIAENAIVGNRVSVRKVLGSGENRWTDNGHGNFWGDPRVYDLDGDGVGDAPYLAGDAFATLAAMRPVLEVFDDTPAARALSWAEDAFPIFDPPRVVDSLPLVHVPAGMVADSPISIAASPRLIILPLGALLLFAPYLRRRNRRTT